MNGRWFFGCLAALLSLPAGLAQAQEVVRPYEFVPTVDWYYASSFGTGRYRAGDRTVSALLIPIGWELGRWGEGEISARLLAPVTIGAINFNLDDVIDDPLDTLSMLTFTPGIELKIPVGEQWLLRPFATFGGGVEFEGNDRALIYSAGVSARRPLPCERVRCVFGVGFTWAGYKASGRNRDDMSSVALGLDFVFPAATTAYGRSWHPGMFALYRNYLTNIDFIFDPFGVAPLSQEWEAGFSLTVDRSFSIFGYRFDRLGLSYRKGGGLTGVHFTGTFPF